MGEPYQVTFQKEGTVLTVRPVGRLDAYAVPSFSEQLEQELNTTENDTTDESGDKIASTQNETSTPPSEAVTDTGAAPAQNTEESNGDTTQ